jgi:hypothetical protein
MIGCVIVDHSFGIRSFGELSPLPDRSAARSRGFNTSNDTRWKHTSEASFTRCRSHRSCLGSLCYSTSTPLQNVA